jgi:hypothetical protein
METFAQLIKEQGSDLVREHLVELWWFIQLGNEEVILETIEELAAHYDDPAHAEVGFIAIWNHLRG